MTRKRMRSRCVLVLPQILMKPVNFLLQFIRETADAHLVIIRASSVLHQFDLTNVIRDGPYSGRVAGKKYINEEV